MSSPFIPCPFQYNDSPQGSIQAPLVVASRNPSNVTDTGYQAGTFWLSDATTGGSGSMYYQGGFTTGAPAWTLASAASGALNTLSDGSTTVLPSGGNIAIVGTPNQITSVGSVPAHEIVLSLPALVNMPGALTVATTLNVTGLTTLSGGVALTGGLTVDTLTSTGATNLATTGANTSAFGNTTGASGLTLSVGTGNLVVQGAATSTMWIGKGLTTGTLLIGGSAMTGAGIITLGSSSASNEVDIANGTGAATVSIANVSTAGCTVNIMEAVNTVANTFNLCSGAVNGDNTVNILNGNAVGGVLTFNVFGSASATTGGIANIGTGAAAHVVNIGNSTPATASQVNIKVGTGSTPDFKLDGLATSKYAIGASTTTGTIVIGGTAMTGAGVITLGSSSASSTVKIASGAGASTVTIGEGTAGANDVEIINGNIAAVGTVKILCGTGTAGAAGSILQMANNTRVATIDLGNVAPAASRTTTIGGGTVIVAAVTDTINVGTGGATTNVNSIKTVNVNTGGVTLGQVLTNIATGTVTSGTHTTSIATGARAAGTMTVNLLTGTGTKSFTGGNADGATTFNFLGPVLVNDSQNSNTSINTGTSTGTVSIGNSLAGAITVASAAAINIDSAVASHFTVTGAAADLTISSVGGSVNVTGTEAAADAIAINASNAAGGIDVNAGTGGIDLDTTGAISIDGVAASNVTVTGAAADLTVSAVGGSVNITASEAVADAIVIQASDAAGGVQISAGTGNITQTGKVLKPTNPTFFYNLAASQLNKTGTGTAYTLGTGATLTKIVDYGTNCTTSGVFTAPVTGTYSLSSQITLTGMTIATTFVISVVTTARTYTNTYTRAAGSTDQTCAINVVADMTATDTAHVTISVTGEAGDTDDIVGAATVQTYFSGFLIG